MRLLASYWQSNMELINLVPEFNLYEEFWRIYTKNDRTTPQFISNTSHVGGSIIGECTEVYGTVEHSVIGSGVYIGEGAVIRDSIIMNDCKLGKNVNIYKGIIAENTTIEENTHIGCFDEVPNRVAPHIYSDGISVIGEGSYIPAGVRIGKNTAISGITVASDYIDGVLPSGENLIKGSDGI